MLLSFSEKTKPTFKYLLYLKGGEKKRLKLLQFLFFNMTCLSWIFQLVIVPLALHLALLHIPVRATSRKCDTIYKGFADCLISLGDSMAQNVQQFKVNEDLDDAEELDSICKSWDDFHKCASSVLINCPEDTAAIWESLRKESRKIQYQGNLHDLCNSRNQQANSMDTGATNKETLRGLACMIQHSLLPIVIAPILVWIVVEKAL